MFRRSGSVVAWLIEGEIPRPGTDDFHAALRSQRFHTIENSASEETSTGWVSPADPTGDTFEHDDMDLDGAVWLRMRIDRKKLPAQWLAIYRAAAERSAGRRLSARERKELKDDLHRQLLPRLLPGVRLIDALLDPRRRMILLFTTGRGVREEFAKLFFKSFGTSLVEADGHGLATAVGLGREHAAYLEEVAPVRWPRADARPGPRLVGADPDSAAAAPRTAGGEA